MSSFQKTFLERFDDLLNLFDDSGKTYIREKYEKEQKAVAIQEEEFAGRQKMKKYIDNIKLTAPSKTLHMLMTLQSEIDWLYGQGQISDMAFDKLNNLVANVDDDNNLFTRFTELMDICNYCESKPAPRMKECVKQELTEAEKLRRANDPKYPCWTQCKKCHRVMTTKYHNSGHSKSKVCGQIVTTKMVSLNNNKFYTHEDSVKQAKLIDPQNFNASSDQIDWGDANKLEKKMDQ